MCSCWEGGLIILQNLYVSAESLSWVIQVSQVSLWLIQIHTRMHAHTRIHTSELVLVGVGGVCKKRYRCICQTQVPMQVTFLQSDHVTQKH